MRLCGNGARWNGLVNKVNCCKPIPQPIIIEADIHDHMSITQKALHLAKVT